MKRFLLILLCALVPMLCCEAQNSKQVRKLKEQKAALEKNLKKSKNDLSNARKKTSAGVQDLNAIGNKLEGSLHRIHDIEQGIDSIDFSIGQTQADIATLEEDIQAKRMRLKAAFRYARMQRHTGNSLLYLLSGSDLRQVYRRARYARDYAVHERALAEGIKAKQEELLAAQSVLLEGKSLMADTIRGVMSERKDLNVKQQQQQRVVADLRKNEAAIEGKVSQQQRELSQLDKKIDQLIAYEIEQARKKAEAEARKRAAAEEARKKEEAKRKAQGGDKGKTPEPKNPSTRSGSTGGTTTGGGSDSPKSSSWLTAEDRKLNGTFEQNKGRLPVPITGEYQVGKRFGTYTVSGTKNVLLDNKGTNYVGRRGAQARAIFDGVVTAIFQFSGMKNVLVRHGSYISVYLNLASVSVYKGQNVHARDILGSVADDGTGNCILQFQLRKETTKLNPEAWIGR